MVLALRDHGTTDGRTKDGSSPRGRTWFCLRRLLIFPCFAYVWLNPQTWGRCCIVQVPYRQLLIEGNSACLIKVRTGIVRRFLLCMGVPTSGRLKRHESSVKKSITTSNAPRTDRRCSKPLRGRESSIIISSHQKDSCGNRSPCNRRRCTCRCRCNILYYD